MPGGQITTESGVGKACDRLFDQHHAYRFRVVQTGRQVRGTPDSLACAYGRFLGVEWKAPAGRHPVSVHQANALRKINTAGGLGIVIRHPDDLAAVLTALADGRPVTVDPDTFHPTPTR